MLEGIRSTEKTGACILRPDTLNAGLDIGSGLQGLAKGCGLPVTIWEAQINAFVAVISKNLIYLE